MAITLITLVPLGCYADGSPRYRFNTTFPTRGVRLLSEGTQFGLGVPEEFETPEQADEAGRQYRASQEPYGAMREYIGVTRMENGKYGAVVNAYHSST